MNITEIKHKLNKHGWCIVPNILNTDEIKEAKQMFYKWQTTIKNHDYLHKTIDPHSIYKYHEAGH
jgi:ectoine hydroxylase-related dioxygenase (phytanoyl-CoA dioxygenase family)